MGIYKNLAEKGIQNLVRKWTKSGPERESPGIKASIKAADAEFNIWSQLV